MCWATGLLKSPFGGSGRVGGELVSVGISSALEAAASGELLDGRCRSNAGGEGDGVISSSACNSDA